MKPPKPRARQRLKLDKPAETGASALAFEAMPINNVRWIHTDDLRSNAWNPNHVLGPEFILIKHSLMTNGWIQPVLVSEEIDAETGETYFEIIDGFHRSTMTKIDPEVAAMTGGRVPAAVLKLSIADRMMLTVRINRAKGSHQASLMHKLIKGLVEDHGLTVEQVSAGIGAAKHEVQRLMMDNVFVKLDIENHTYSRAWRPTVKGQAAVELEPQA